MLELLIILSGLGLCLSFKNVQQHQKEKTIRQNKRKLLAVILIISLNVPLQAQKQLYIGGSFMSNGAGLNVGVKKSNAVLEVGYNNPLTRSDVATLVYSKIGVELNLTRKEQDNLTLTPFIGVSGYFLDDFSKYDNDGSITRIKTVKPYYSLELGKDWYMGRLFVNAGYCGGSFFGVGMKVFF